jgi:hypothetical protein
MAFAVRVLSVVAWCVFAAILLRMLSGGGTLQGVGYVLRTEPPVEVALMGASLIVATVSIVGRVRDLPWASPFSRIAAAIGLVTSLVLDQGHHQSAIVAAAALGLVLLLDLIGGRIPLIRGRA